MTRACWQTMPTTGGTVWRTWHAALAAALKSVEIAPSLYGWDVLARVYFALGRYEEALKAEETASKMTGSS